MANEGQAWLAKFPGNERDAVEALIAVQNTVAGRYQAMQLQKAYSPHDLMIKPNPRRGQAFLNTLTSPPPIFKATQTPPAPVSSAVLNDEIAKHEGAAGTTPPTVQGAGPSAPVAPAGRASAPFSNTIVHAALISALTQLQLTAIPTDAARRQTVYNLTIDLLQKQGYTPQEIAKVPKP